MLMCIRKSPWPCTGHLLLSPFTTLCCITLERPLNKSGESSLLRRESPHGESEDIPRNRVSKYARVCLNLISTHWKKGFADLWAALRQQPRQNSQTASTCSKQRSVNCIWCKWNRKDMFRSISDSAFVETDKDGSFFSNEPLCSWINILTNKSCASIHVPLKYY